ncbi:Thioesterase superfamily [Chlamydia trachomatis]|nr:Thioesterase superfamily [Chlamydia trachomatis]
MGSLPSLRYVTAHLGLDYLAPTPMGSPLDLRATIQEVTDRKVVMHLELWAEQRLRVEGRMVSVLLR